MKHGKQMASTKSPCQVVNECALTPDTPEAKYITAIDTALSHAQLAVNALLDAASIAYPHSTMTTERAIAETLHNMATTNLYALRTFVSRSIGMPMERDTQQG